ncbi:hypothetical protein TNIN_282371 [Trichonephila inaurata madagascariensis]|uniref:Uncharacterized protein n=1 Tax=Trichonephila inaurata madagascariensis TaxID=2747483 RepID=A0A8X7CIB5_9ARAC|nr:hypothetical protein TNIN_282371 [Trichonephila inaurata madagascariensis]
MEENSTQDDKEICGCTDVLMFIGRNVVVAKGFGLSNGFSISLSTGTASVLVKKTSESMRSGNVVRIKLKYVWCSKLPLVLVLDFLTLTALLSKDLVASYGPIHV